MKKLIIKNNLETFFGILIFLWAFSLFQEDDNDNQLNDTKLNTMADTTPKTLHLTLKKKWFDMIKSGEKREEYREIKEYWITRLKDRNYDIVEFRNGYAKDAPTLRIEIEKIDIGHGRTSWGADPDEEYFVIQLGQILEGGAA